ncbi:Uncharacterised protein [Acinetobacter baumannii]|nr:Uncharacterised protein [Acinetobacter baumannii]
MPGVMKVQVSDLTSISQFTPKRIKALGITSKDLLFIKTF